MLLQRRHEWDGNLVRMSLEAMPPELAADAFPDAYPAGILHGFDTGVRFEKSSPVQKAVHLAIPVQNLDRMAAALSQGEL
jgi:hypothetical protein